MKRKIIYSFMTILIIILVAIAVISIQGVKVTDISLVENQDSDSFEMVFNIPVETRRIELVKVKKDEGIWIGEHRYQIDNLDCSVLEILLYDVHISDELRKEAGESSVSITESLDVVHLGDGIEYLIAYPPDDSMTIIYLFIENRIVDVKGLNLVDRHYLKELEINIGKECIDCFEPRFVSYTQNSYEPVREFKMVKRHTFYGAGNGEADTEEIEMPYGNHVNADWSGNINFTDDIKAGVLSKVNEETGIEHFESRDIYDYAGTMDVGHGEKAYLEFWFEGGETQGIIEYSLLDEFNDINYYKIPMAAILFTSSVDVDSKAWQEENEDQSEWDSKLDEFMNSLMNKDYDKVLEMVGLTEFRLDFFYDDKMKSDIRDAYSFLNSFELIGYKILDSNLGKYNVMRYTIELEVFESSTEFIQEGNSIWYVEIGVDGSSVIQLFKPVKEKELNYGRFSDKNSPEYFVYRAATYLQLFDTIDDFNDIVPYLDSKERYFDQFCVRMMKLLNNRFENGYITAEALGKEVEKIFGITYVDFTKHSYYDSETDSMSFREGGGSWMFESLVSLDFDNETGIHTVIIDFYTDAAYILKAKTVKYEVMNMGEDGYKMISTELIYDSGYDPFMDNI